MARWLHARHGRGSVSDDLASPADRDATRVEGGPRAKHATRKNVGRTERLGSTIGGGALAAYGARRRDPVGAALALLGLAIAGRGVTGHCAVYQSLGIDRSRRGSEGVEQQHGPAAVLDASHAERVEHAVVVDRPLEELWRYWRQLENLPTIMRHLESVTEHDDGRSTWVAHGPAGRRVRWDATIINEVANQLLAWKSLDGADVPNAGSVHFTPVENGTEIRVVLEYDPPAGRVGALVAALFGDNPDKQVRDDLEAFRMAMEELEHDASRRDREVAVPSSTERGAQAGGATLARGTDEQPPAVGPSSDGTADTQQRGDSSSA